MFVEMAVGDAFAAAFEYANENLPFNEPSRGYIKHPRHNIGAGRYTDDTQMGIAVAECLLAEEAWTQQNLAARFLKAFKRDPRPGYAGAFYEFLKRIETPEQFLAEIRPDSDKSGGAMRAPVIGLLPDIGDVLLKARTQAAVTHNTPIGMTGAMVAAAMTHYFHYKLGPKESLGQWLDGMLLSYCVSPRISVRSIFEPGYSWDEPWQGKVRAQGWMAPHAAVSAIMHEQSLTEILKACVAYTGDTDTVATIALAAASRSPEVVQDLPESLFVGLEAGEYGIDYLRSLDEKLLAKFPPAP